MPVFRPCSAITRTQTQNEGIVDQAPICRRRDSCCVLGLVFGAWMERDELYDLRHPLPSKRFTALLNWPKTSDSHIAPMLTGVLSAIKSELARLEVFDRNFFVISPEDLSQDLPTSTHLKDVCDPLGANLAMTASGLTRGNHFELQLRLLDPITSRIVRQREVRCSFSEITLLPGQAVHTAASLLNLSQYLKSDARLVPDTQSAAAFNAFQTAETLAKAAK